MIEAESLFESIEVSSGTLSTAEAWWLNKGQEVVWSGVEPGASLTVEFETRTQDPAHLALLLTEGPDRGRFRVELDGVPLEPELDLYGPAWRPRDYFAEMPEPRPGRHTLRLVCLGKSRHSEGMTLGLDAVQCVPVHRAQD